MFSEDKILLKSQMQLFLHPVRAVSPDSLIFFFRDSLQNTVVISQAVEMPWIQLHQTSAARISSEQERDQRHEGKKRCSHPALLRRWLWYFWWLISGGL